MPLHEVIQRTVANNLDVKVAGYGPPSKRRAVVEAEAHFDPTFFTNFAVHNSNVAGAERRHQSPSHPMKHQRPHLTARPASGRTSTAAGA